MKMSIQKNYEEFKAKQAAFFSTPMSKMWQHQEKRYLKPFQIFGNLYYVGETWLCMHLVDTSDGLFLLDAGNFNTSGMLINAIWEVGFNPADIKWVVLSHGHVDHIGNADFLRNMFGCTLYIGEPDADMFTNNPALSYIHGNPNIADGLFEPDAVIRDGDFLQFGNTEITCFLVPGHTAGAIACFFDVTDGNETKRAGYYGGFGFNTLTKDYLQAIGDTDYTMRQIYLASLDKVMNEPVDIFLGNHANNNQIIEKREYQLQHPETNPYIDPGAWRQYLEEKKTALLALMNDPKNN
jgi:metallo-beta-lactamase class B